MSYKDVCIAPVGRGFVFMWPEGTAMAQTVLRLKYILWRRFNHSSQSMMLASLTKPRKVSASLSERVAMRRHCSSWRRSPQCPSAACRRSDHSYAGACDDGVE